MFLNASHKADFVGLFLVAFVATLGLCAWAQWAVNYNTALRALL
jgi:hypothetical protein